MPRRRDDETLRAIGARMREYRQRRGYTQAELAEAVGIEAVTLARYEAGARSVSLSTLAGIASALGVGLGELCTIDRPPPQPTSRPGEEAALRSLRQLDTPRLDLAVALIGALSHWNG
jgi:transcriptional regulator with XRE-family HTH domain